MECEECKYWKHSGFPPEEGEKDEGFCHRRSPSIVAGMIIREREDTAEDEYGLAQYEKTWECLEAVWPKTFGGEWCGEFETKDKID